MELKNGYKVIYEATREDIGEKRFYGSKILQGVEEKMLVSYNGESGEYVDLSQFKLIYTDMEQLHLFGSVSGLPTDEDIHISIYDLDGNLVFGCNDVPPVPPTPKHAVTVGNVENCTITGAGQYEEGANVVVVIKPAEGYRFGNGNAPKVGEIAMVADGDGFKHEFVMGTEDINIVITGVVVEAIPELAEVYYSIVEEASSDLSVGYTDEHTAAEMYADYVVCPYEKVPTEVSEGYFRFAFKNGVDLPTALYQKGLEADQLGAFNKTETSYEGVNYTVYVQKEAGWTGSDYSFKFVK